MLVLFKNTLTWKMKYFTFPWGIFYMSLFERAHWKMLPHHQSPKKVTGQAFCQNQNRPLLIGGFSFCHNKTSPHFSPLFFSSEEADWSGHKPPGSAATSLDLPKAHLTRNTQLLLAKMSLVLQTTSWTDSTPDPYVKRWHSRVKKNIQFDRRKDGIRFKMNEGMEEFNTLTSVREEYSSTAALRSSICRPFCKNQTNTRQLWVSWRIC